MRRQGPITVRHLIVAVLIMVVVNAQLTWWVIFVLRLGRENLDLERQSLLSAARVEAMRVETELETARTALEAALLMGDVPGRDAVVGRLPVGLSQPVRRDRAWCCGGQSMR